MSDKSEPVQATETDITTDPQERTQAFLAALAQAEQAKDEPQEPEPEDELKEEPTKEEPESKDQDQPAEPETKDQAKPEDQQQAQAEQDKDEPKDESLDRSWDAVVRAQKRLREEKTKLKAEQESSKTQAELIQRLKSGDYSVLDQLGISYQDWTKQRLSSLEKDKDASDSESKVAKEIQELKSQLQQDREARQQAEYQRYLDEYKGNLRATAESSEQYELVRGYEDDALDVAIMHYQSTGEVMDPKDALSAIQDQIVRDLRGRLNATTIKKYLPDVYQELEKAFKPAQQESKPTGKKSKTLSNHLDSESDRAPKIHDADQLMSMEDRHKLAMRLLVEQESSG